MTRYQRNKAIGVFDSGLGGLTVVKELMRSLANEKIIYFGDTARVPYGTKSRESIIRFSKENTDVLLKYKVKLIVVACHSSTSHALAILKKSYDIPFIGVIEPGVNKSLSSTNNGRIGVIATPATINSGQYQKAIHRRNPLAKIFVQACPLFVPLAEEGWQSNNVTVGVAQEYLKGLKKKGIDTLILGCTHYPLLKNVIQKVMGQGVTLIDSAKEAAEDVWRLLDESDCAGTSRLKGKHQFLISDRPQNFKRVAKKFLGREISARKI